MRHSADTLVVVGAFVLLLAAGSLSGATGVLTFDDATFGPANAPCVDNPRPPLFNRAEYAGATAAYIVDPAGCGEGQAGGTNGSDSLRTTEFSSTPPGSNELRFSWVDPANDDTWVRLWTASASGVIPWRQAPTVDIRPGSSISMDVLIFGQDAGGVVNDSGQLEFSLALRETDRNLPLGLNGGTTGPVEFVGVNCVGLATGCPGGSTTDVRTPVGGVALSPSAFFTTIKWQFVDDGGVTKVDVSVGGGTPVRRNIAAWTGNGILSTPTHRATLDSLTVRKAPTDDVTKKWFINIDNIVIDAPGVLDPVLVNGPVSNLHQKVTVSYIDPTATEVRLYINNVLVRTATSPSEDFSDGAHTFTGLEFAAGDVITAMQVVGGIEEPRSAGLVVSDGVTIDDFELGVNGGASRNPTAAAPAAPRVWYQVNSQAFATSDTVQWSNSAALRIRDGGNMNGVYAVYDGVVPATGQYQVQAKMHMTEDESVPDGAKQYQMGVIVNGVHRDITSCGSPGCKTYRCHNESLLAVDTTLPGNVVGNYAGITTGNDSGLPPQQVITGVFSANEGDSLLIVFSTNVETQWQDLTVSTIDNRLDPLDTCETPGGFPPAPRPVFNAQGTWNWGVSRFLTAGATTGLGGGWNVRVDDIKLVKIIPCTQIDPVHVDTPLVAGQTQVKVSQIDPTANLVTVYANATKVGTAEPGGSTSVFVPVTPALSSAQVVTATQTIGDVEGCLPDVGPAVDDCNQVGTVSVAGPVSAGGTFVTVNGVSESAVAVTVYANGTQLAQLTALSGDGTEDVPVPPLVKNQWIAATQTLPATQSSAGTLQGCVPTSGQTVGSGGNAAIRLSLGIREVDGLAGPIGADGGVPPSTAIEFVIPDDPNDPDDGRLVQVDTPNNGPSGKLIMPSTQWQTVTFNVPGDVIKSYTLGNDVLNGAFGVLEHLAITMNAAAPDVGPYTLYIDNIYNGQTLLSDFESAAVDTQVIFRNPGQAGTSSNLSTPPNSTAVTNWYGDASIKSLRVRWRFRDEAATRWFRLTTQNTEALPNPQVDLSQPITMRVLLLPPKACAGLFADTDGDHDVDMDDFGAFQLCFNPLIVAPGCECFDRDRNGGVNLLDFAKFEQCATGPGIPWVSSPQCP